jgi:hypothetical protein
MKAQRVSRGIALLFLNLGAIWGECVFNSTPRLLHPRGRDLVHTVPEAEWAPGPVWTGAENLAAAGIRSPDRPPRSESLYRQLYTKKEIS